jgi:hypothetical protein
MSRYLSAVALLFALILMAPGGVQAVEEGSAEEAFERAYARIMEDVRTGELPQRVGEKAADLRHEYRIYRIETDARLEVLELEITEGEAAERSEHLEELRELTVERTLVSRDYLDRLKALSDSETSAAQPEADPEPKSRREDAAGPALDIRSEPEDVTQGRFE